LSPAPVDAVVVGAGPNGLAAAITLARAGRSVKVLEAAATPGGGCRSAELTLPGFVHDVCSAVHPMAAGSPFFKALDLAARGLELVEPPACLAHVFDDMPAAVVERSLEMTAVGLERDGGAWRSLLRPLVDHADDLIAEIMGPLPLLPRHPFVLARFGLEAILPATRLAGLRFRGPRARALFAGVAAHSILSLDEVITSAFALVMTTLAHTVGWPVVRGGSGRLIAALVAELEALGGTVETGHPVQSTGELAGARAVLFDVTPRQLLAICGDELPPRYRGALQRYRYGPGVFKLDWALSAPIPWRDPACGGAGTVHLGGTLDEVRASEAAVHAGRVAERPFVILVQPSLFDPSRAPSGKHTAWAYCHVPPGFEQDMSDAIEAQVERFAPGFRDVVLERHAISPRDLETYNANYVGGDINGGRQDWRQLFTRPTVRPDPYSTPNPRFFICSSATPPGGAVHGMCGFHAARSALRKALA